MRVRARSWVGGAALLALVPLLAAAGGAPERALTPDPDAERELVKRINRSREREGLPRLKSDPLLAQAARAHALEMAKRAQVAHSFPQEPGLRPRVASTGLRFDFVGENVGRARDAELMHEDFLLSPGHRQNILQTRVNSVGVGAVRAGDDLFVTETFAHVVPDYDSEDAEKLVARQVKELREQAGLPPLERETLGPVREEACAMAARDTVDASHRPAPRLRGTLHTVAYSSADPERIPEQLRDEVARQRSQSFSVGACFARTPSYPAGAYWVVVVFYFPQK